MLYGVASATAVFVLDQYGQIMDKGALVELARLERVAEKVAEGVEEERRSF